jgi:hypothetical protein
MYHTLARMKYFVFISVSKDFAATSTYCRGMWPTALDPRVPFITTCLTATLNTSRGREKHVQQKLFTKEN